MKKSTLLFILSVILLSCTEVIFEEPQPPGVNSISKIPKELLGKYSFVILNEETLMEIGPDFITNEDEKSYLSDSLVVKRIGKKIFVNKLISEGEKKLGKWNTYILEDKGCGFVKATTFVISSDSYSELFKETYTAAQIGQGQEKSLVIKPTRDQFDSILEDDSVTISIILERVE